MPVYCLTLNYLVRPPLSAGSTPRGWTGSWRPKPQLFWLMAVASYNTTITNVSSVSCMWTRLSPRLSHHRGALWRDTLYQKNVIKSPLCAQPNKSPLCARLSPNKSPLCVKLFPHSQTSRHYAWSSFPKVTIVHTAKQVAIMCTVISQQVGIKYSLSYVIKQEDC